MKEKKCKSMSDLNSENHPHRHYLFETAFLPIEGLLD